jgi:hypothetical protein
LGVRIQPIVLLLLWLLMLGVEQALWLRHRRWCAQGTCRCVSVQLIVPPCLECCCSSRVSGHVLRKKPRMLQLRLECCLQLLQVHQLRLHVMRQGLELSPHQLLLLLLLVGPRALLLLLLVGRRALLLLLACHATIFLLHLLHGHISLQVSYA